MSTSQYGQEEADSLLTDENINLVSAKLRELRLRLLDSSRRNPLISIRFTPTSTSFIRVVDELPDILRHNLLQAKQMKLAALPALEDQLPDEQTDQFQGALFVAKQEDEVYLSEISQSEPDGARAEERLLNAERELRDRLRETNGLPPRPTKDAPSLADHARIHGINPSYILPLPSDEHTDGRHGDSNIQTLLLPDRLQRSAKSILEKARSFERETGVNVLHAAFGLLEWKSPDENERFVSPLLLLEIRIERKQSSKGAEFFVHGVDQIMVNTNLTLKLSNEKKLALPEYEGGSVESYFELVAKAEPSGWLWKVRREVCFGIFPSSKIAMYHDLDPEKRPVARDKAVVRLLATTGVGDGTYAKTYGTDDPDVARKVPYVVWDADASQYSALVDVADGRNLAIEGPPGSGKSQTIVNLIASALADGKKVLFVAEKLTALDVVRSRLDAAGLGNFILPLQAGRGTTEAVYESVEARLEMSRKSTLGQHSFETRQRALERDRANLQGYLDALGAFLGSTGLTVHQVFGHAIATAETLKTLPREIRRIPIRNAEAMDAVSIEQLLSEVDAYGARLRDLVRMPVIWRVSTSPIASRDAAEDLAEEATRIAKELESFEREIAEASIANFMTESPLLFDMETIGRLLSAAAREGERVDPDVLDHLIDPAARRAARELCGQIRERRSLLTTLGESLRNAEDWNLGRLIDVARFTSAQDGRLDPAQHRARLSEIENAINDLREVIVVAELLPSSWTRNSQNLSEIRDEARRIAAFSPETLSLRRLGSTENVGAVAYALKAEADRLKDKHNRIREMLSYADGSHNSNELRTAASVISGAGFLGRLSSSYKASRGMYESVLGGKLGKSRQEVARHLSEYADWLDSRRAFDNTSNYVERFGNLFRGISTDLADIEQVVAFYGICKEIADYRNELKSYLEAGNIAPVLSFSNLKNVPELSLAQVKTKLSELEQLAEKERGYLATAEEYLSLFQGKEFLTLSELEGIQANKAAETELRELIENSPLRDRLGLNFSGPDARTDMLEFACDLSAAIAATKSAEQMLAAIRSGRAGELAREFETFAARRARLESTVANFALDLGLPPDQSTPIALSKRTADLKEAAADPQSLLDRVPLKRAEDSLRGKGLGELIDWAMSEGETLDPSRLAQIVRALIARSMADIALREWSLALQGYDGHDLDRIRSDIRSKDREMLVLSRAAVAEKLLGSARPPAGNSVGRKSSLTDMSLIYNELNKKKNRIGIRELTSRAGRALLELKPCWMMSPLAVAQYLGRDMRFDLVVIDEASQMTPENAIGAISRAKQVVVVGDTKQLPPTTFFQKVLDDSDTDEDLREDSESILDMANVAFMPVRQLRWHYRSRHSSLIQFSNQWMYNGELTIFPSAQEDHPDLGVELIELPGIYKGRRNEIEVRAIISAAVHHMTHRPELSLGICTMNADQKDLILEEFERERERNPSVQAFVEKWENEKDALEEFFVKNIETIQGDERDVMMISTLYGPETPGGRVLQRFGPINSAQGHRRLNVLFTRAKRKIVTFTSMKPTDILVDGSKALGVKMFRAWLEYSKTGRIPDASGPQGRTESPFEDYVATQIERLGYEAVPQVGVAGFRIDLGVRHSSWPYGYILGVECDGAAYHSSKSSRDRDRLRQEVLEDLGWRLHRIWSTDWFRNPGAEIEALKGAIDAALADAKANSMKRSERLDATTLLTRLVPESAPVIDARPAKEGSDRSLSDSAKSAPQIKMHVQMGLALEPPSGSDLFAVSIRPPAEPIIELGSKVKVQSITDGKKLAFILVEGENSPGDGRVGIHTPLGGALLGAQVGDEVEYQVGSHIKAVRVLEIL